MQGIVLESGGGRKSMTLTFLGSGGLQDRVEKEISTAHLLVSRGRKGQKACECFLEPLNLRRIFFLRRLFF